MPRKRLPKRRILLLLGATSVALTVLFTFVPWKSSRQELCWNTGSSRRTQTYLGTIEFQRETISPIKLRFGGNILHDWRPLCTSEHYLWGATRSCSCLCSCLCEGLLGELHTKYAHEYMRNLGDEELQSLYVALRGSDEKKLAEFDRKFESFVRTY